MNPSNAFQESSSRTPILPDELHILKEGDHICWHRSYLIWHHAIVVKTDCSGELIEVIHFNKTSGTTTIVQDRFQDVKQSGQLFRLNYSQDINTKNPPEIVKRRAQDELYKTGYNLLFNNCEHFAVYCKTGNRLSHQVSRTYKKIKKAIFKCCVNMLKFEKIKQFCFRIYKSLAVTVKTIGGHFLGWIRESSKAYKYTNSIKQCVDKLIGRAYEIVKPLKESFRKLVAAFKEPVKRCAHQIDAEEFRLGLNLSLEIIDCFYDIKQMHQNKKMGDMILMDFKISVTQRLTEGVFRCSWDIFIYWLHLCEQTTVQNLVFYCLMILVGSLVVPLIGSATGNQLGELLFGKNRKPFMRSNSSKSIS